MKMSKAFRKFVEDAKASDSYWVELAKLDFSMALEKRRNSEKMSYADFAKKLKTSAAYITKVFRGDSNLTIESMVKLARATGGRIDIQIVDEHVDSKRWAGAIVNLPKNAANHNPLRTGNVIAISPAKDRDDRSAA